MDPNDLCVKRALRTLENAKRSIVSVRAAYEFSNSVTDRNATISYGRVLLFFLLLPFALPFAFIYAQTEIYYRHFRLGEL